MKDGDVITLQWWPKHKPMPDGAIEHPPGPYQTGHDYWSRLIEIPNEEKSP